MAKARVLIRPKEGILDPRARRRAGAAGARLRGDRARAGRADGRARGRRPEQLAELCEKLLANPLIEDYEIQPL